MEQTSMEILQIPLSEIHPYKNNARDNKRAVDKVAESIRQFGMRQPLVIDKDKYIVVGHTRYKALRKLGAKTAPCVLAGDLTEDQVKAYRLADNKVGEIAKWNFKLQTELSSIKSIDMGKFGFDFGLAEKVKQKHEQNKEDTQNTKENILNLAIAQYPGVGKYDIPEILPVYELPEITDWIGFNYVLSDKRTDAEKAHIGVHFFIDDYQFERIWNSPETYIEKLKSYACVLSPDFSPYGDMPMATQIFNHYRKHWVAAYMQDAGITVIPTIRASTHPGCFEWYLDGEPKHSIVAISTMWVKENTDIWQDWEREYQTMLNTLKPKKIFIYGHVPSNVHFENIEHIAKFTEKRFGNQ